MKKYIPKIILIDTVIYIIIFITLFFILKVFNLMFREWIYILSAVIIALGLIVGIVQLILKLKKRNLKIGLIITSVIILILLTPMMYLTFAFGYAPEHVVNKDGKKYVAYVNSFLGTYVHYYDYKNIFVVGNKLKIKEYYGNGGYDPIKNKYGYKYEVLTTTYYDENGNIISTDEMYYN